MNSQQEAAEEVESVPTRVLPLSFEIRCKSQAGGGSYRYNTFLRQVQSPTELHVRRESRSGDSEYKATNRSNFVSRLSKEEEEEIMKPHPRFSELLRKDQNPAAQEQALQLRIYKSVPKNKNRK